MNTYKVTATTANNDVEAEIMEANTPEEAAFLLGVQFGVQSAMGRLDIFELADHLLGWGPKEAADHYADSVRESLGSLDVEQI